MAREATWYEEFIEPGIRERVRLLRDNGFNTEASCEHEMYIQVRCTGKNEEADKLYALLCNSGERNFSIEYKVDVMDGWPRCWMDVKFPKKGQKP